MTDSGNNGARPNVLQCFRSNGKIVIVKRADMLNRPSTSSAPPLEPLEKPLITSPVRERTARTSFDLRLIELVRHRRCLYDGRTPGGTNAVFRMQIWDGLARVLDFEPGGFELQKRWKQLRDKYVKHRRLLAERGNVQQFNVRQSAAAHLFHKLTFLDRYIVQREQSPLGLPLHHTSAGARSRHFYTSEEVDEFTRRLISAVRAQPVLYSLAEANYRSPPARLAAWNAVLAALDFPCDVFEVQKYWKSIRDRYIRIRRSLSDPSGLSPPASPDGNATTTSRAAAAGGEGEQPGGWAHYADLRWIDPFLEHHDRMRREWALARQAADRARRGLEAVVDTQRDTVVVDYEVDREDVQASLLYDDQTRLLESGVRFDGDTAFAASVIADIRALPAERQPDIRAAIEAELERVQQLRQRQQKRLQQLQQPLHLSTGLGMIGEVSREEIVNDTVIERD